MCPTTTLDGRADGWTCQRLTPPLATSADKWEARVEVVVAKQCAGEGRGGGGRGEQNSVCKDLVLKKLMCDG